MDTVDTELDSFKEKGRLSGEGYRIKKNSLLLKETFIKLKNKYPDIKLKYIKFVIREFKKEIINCLKYNKEVRIPLFGSIQLKRTEDQSYINYSRYVREVIYPQLVMKYGKPLKDPRDIERFKQQIQLPINRKKSIIDDKVLQ